LQSSTRREMETFRDAPGGQRFDRRDLELLRQQRAAKDKKGYTASICS
jgi:hypothetical protein